MTKFSDVTWLETSQENHTESYWDHVCAWAMDTPPTTMAVSAAENLAQNCQETYQHLIQASSTWNQFREYYGGADKDAVFSALDPVIEKLIALKRAGEVFYGGVQLYDAGLAILDGMKTDYDEWATTWMEKYREVESYQQNHTEEEFTAKYGKPYNELSVEMREERDNREMSGPVFIVDTIRACRKDLIDVLDGIDMDELGEMEFSHRPEALETYESAEELANALKNSHVFGNTDLTDADYEEIAQRMWENRDQLPYDYMDANGTKWVFGPDGELVRSGSPMDPNLNASALLVIDQEDRWRDIALNFPDSPLGGTNENVQTASQLLVQTGLKQGGNALVPVDQVVGRGVISGTATALVTLIGTGIDAAQYERNTAETTPLLSTEQAEGRQQRYVNENLIMDGVEVTTASGTAVLTSILGPGGTLLGMAVTYVATGVTEYIINDVADETWTREEMVEAFENGEFS
ncbi:hypothetical protein [Citricoccus sp. GCM10030269]|uniref:hypothetical protein n=1 Tax=Citricoccus sp. GCM10030269 TaxID=3273388 RepID=UPI00361EA514